MKKSYSFAIAAIFAALMSIPSCSYLEEPGKNENTGKEPGTRTVNLCFPQTKTTLDGYQPVWSAGDQIILADGTGTETYTVSAEDEGKTKITIPTKLTEKITAVYPSDVAVVEEEHTIKGIKVSANQDGSFAKANICLAVEDDESSNLMFKNQTAVIKVRVPAGTTKLTVTSLGKIGENGQRGTAAKDVVSINDAGSAPDCNVTTVSGDNAFDGDCCFVSVLVVDDNPLYLTDLNFDVEYTDGSKETHKAQGGFSPLSIKAAGVADPYTYKVKKNDLHTLAASSLHEYVVVGEGEKARKWATMNIGATSKTDYGDYFAWGATEVAYDNLTGGTFTFKSTKPSSYVYSNGYVGAWTPDKGFDVKNTPYYDGDIYSASKYNNGSGKKVLDLCDDAAFWNWGGSWRMPTIGEFAAIKETKSDWASGYSFGSGSNTFFLPAAGYGIDKQLMSAGTIGRYWSSSLYSASGEHSKGQYLHCPNGDVVITGLSRDSGLSVRALSE